MARPKRKAAMPGAGKAQVADFSSDEEKSEDDILVLSDDGDDSSGRIAKRSKPRTPQRKPAAAKRRRLGSQARAVVEVESDSSDSDFVAAEAPTSDDNDDSDYNYERRRSEKVAKTLYAAHRDARKARAPRKGRARKKPVEPTVRLDWQMSEDEWGNVWWDDDPTDAESVPTKAKKFAVEQREPSAELLLPLLPFQKEWLAWSLRQESGTLKGGILADEMGMGKTIQAISLVVTARHIHVPSTPSSSAAAGLEIGPGCGGHCSEPLPQALPPVKGTLVVCPLVAVIQWRNEIAKFTASGSVKVLVYHGPNRSIDLAKLAEYDIILTTYAIVETEHRKLLPPKVTCEWCTRLFFPERLKVHQKYFCGPHAQRTAKQAKQQKGRRGLNKLQMSEMAYEDEDTNGDSDDDVPLLKRKMALKGKNASSKKGKAQVPPSKPPANGGNGRGSRKRKIGPEELESSLFEASKAAGLVDERPSSSSTPQKNSVLHTVRWTRIILDEAHSIKDRRTSTAKAVFALQSEYKWALSGTPLQNRVGELYSLVRFLAIKPFSYYFCRKCNCKSLDFKFSAPKEKCECGHAPMLHFCWWNKYIANPIKRWGYVNEGRRAMMLLKHRVLSNTLLRRTKLERAADLTLPPRTTFLRRDAFDAREEDFYQALYTQSQSQFNTYVTAGTLVNNYAHIFDLLTRLRQAVDHPYLVLYSPSSGQAMPSLASSTTLGECGICNQVAEDAVSTACLHIFCRSCIQDYIADTTDAISQCPKCENPLTVDLTASKTTTNGMERTSKELGFKRTSIISKLDLTQFQTSTKIDAVREEIDLMLRNDPAAKAIIFSQFTSFLDLIGFCLLKSGIKHVKLDGSMTMGARDQMIESFTNDVDTKIFLMSLKAGGVALNLTVASHVFLMDPWWNPAVEQQAQDRIHRLGQFKPIRVTRFVIENTIEERILKLQEKKQLVFEGTVGGSSEALGRLTEDDLRFLFTN